MRYTPPASTTQAHFSQTNYAQMFIFDTAREINKARTQMIVEKEYGYLDIAFEKTKILYYVFIDVIGDKEEEIEKIVKDIEERSKGDLIHTADLTSYDLKQIDVKIMEFFRLVMKRLGSARLITPYKKTESMPVHMRE